MQVRDGQTFSSMFGENGSKTIKKNSIRCFRVTNFFSHDRNDNLFNRNMSEKYHFCGKSRVLRRELRVFVSELLTRKLVSTLSLQFVLLFTHTKIQ